MRHTMPTRRLQDDAERLPGDVTALLHRARRGDPDALNTLVPLVYRELKQQAAGQLRSEARRLTIQPTVLVHETYLRLVENQRIQWRSRAHFFAVSARLMRRILVDYARARHAQKRGHGATHVALTDAGRGTERPERLVDLLALDEALARLEVLDLRQAQVVEMRMFAGLTVDETASALDVSPRTVKSDWQMARAWLSRELRAE
jgi:RNA polymerase sigma factor (TIGR02999 family)